VSGRARPTRLWWLTLRGWALVVLLGCSAWVAIAWWGRIRPRPVDAERRQLARQTGWAPGALALRQEERVLLRGVARHWQYRGPDSQVADMWTWRSRLALVHFPAAKPAVAVAQEWRGPLELAGPGRARIRSATVAAGDGQSQFPGSYTRARDTGLLAAGALFGLQPDDAAGRRLLPALEWTGVDAARPGGPPSALVSLAFSSPPRGVPRKVTVRVVPATGHVESLRVDQW